MRTGTRFAALGAAVLGAAAVAAPMVATADDTEDVPVTVTVEGATGGGLTLSFVKEQPDVGISEIDGASAPLGGTAEGWLGRITVEDLRTGAAGWDLSATVTDFFGPTGNSIPVSSNLTTLGAFWSATHVGVTVADSPATGFGPRPIATADSTSTGGTQLFDLDMHSTLFIPGAIAPGDYSSTYTLDLIGF